MSFGFIPLPTLDHLPPLPSEPDPFHTRAPPVFARENQVRGVVARPLCVRNGGNCGARNSGRPRGCPLWHECVAIDPWRWRRMVEQPVNVAALGAALHR